MTPEQFCYWLNGFGELSAEPPTLEQWRAIKEHLAEVFHKVTPPAPGQLPIRAPLVGPIGPAYPQPLPPQVAPVYPGQPPVITC